MSTSNRKQQINRDNIEDTQHRDFDSIKGVDGIPDKMPTCKAMFDQLLCPVSERCLAKRETTHSMR